MADTPRLKLLAEQPDAPINVSGGSWGTLPKGSKVTGVNGTETVWKTNGRGGLVKVRD